MWTEGRMADNNAFFILNMQKCNNEDLSDSATFALKLFAPNACLPLRQNIKRDRSGFPTSLIS